MKRTTPWLGLLILTSCGAAPAQTQTAQEYPPASWSPELGPAFRLYYANDYPAVQHLCAQMGGATRDARLRRDAETLATMALIRSAGRDNQRDGKTRLLQLSQEDPRLLSRPDCRFALGFAEMGIYATAAALQEFDTAARAFVANGRSARAAEAYAALAQAWSQHSEWEFAVPAFNIRRPDNLAQANQIRIEQIEAVRVRAAGLPEPDDALDQIDRILAELLLRVEGREEEGVRTLTRLAEREPMTINAARAALSLAQRYESMTRWKEALALYERVKAAQLGETAVQAERHLNEILAPQLNLEVPAQAVPGAPVPIRVTARNIAHLDVEVRRVDLIEWLNQRQGRFEESALPVSGAALAAWEWRIAAAQPFEWWESDREASPPSFAAPAGAAVVVARASDGQGHALAVKRLVIGGRLQAHAFFGPEHIALWATRDDVADVSVPAPNCEAYFWMYGSFVPQRWTLDEPAAVFPLPSGTQILRDKRWIIVLRGGDELAVCRGVLANDAKDGKSMAVLLSGGPAEVRVGEEIHIAGRLIGALPKTDPARSVELTFVDSADRIVSSTNLNLLPEATFSTHLAIDEALANKTLQVQVRYAGLTPTSIHAPLYFRILPLDEPTFAARFDIPPVWPPDQKDYAVLLTAAYPWGMPVSEEHVNLTIQPLVMPVTPSGQPGYTVLCRMGHTDTDAFGRVRMEQNLDSYQLPPGPRALGLWAECAGWDGRKVSATAEAIVADEPVHLWIEIEEETLQTGRPIHFQVHWFDPAGLTAGRAPTMSVRRAGAEWHDIELAPFLHFVRGAAWRPPAPGTYEMRAVLAADDGREFATSGVFEIANINDSIQGDVDVPLLTARRATRDARAGVEIRFTDAAGPLLLLLHAAGDPRAARGITFDDATTEVFIPLANETADSLNVLAFREETAGAAPTPIVHFTVSSVSGRKLTITYQHDAHLPRPGDRLESIVTCARGATPLEQGVLVARMIDINRSGGVQWIPGENRTDTCFLPGGLRQAASVAVEESTANEPILETRELPAELSLAWFGGTTRWISVEPIQDGSAHPIIPLPPDPGYYRLLLSVYAASDEYALKAVDFDLRQGLFLETSLPDQLYLGDRVDVCLRVENAAPQPRDLTFSCLEGAELRHEGWRIRPTTPGQAAPSWNETLPLRLEPHQTVLLSARIEAAQAGVNDGTSLYSLKSADGQWQAVPSCTVLGIEEKAAGAATSRLTLERSLFRLRREPLTAEEDEQIAAGMMQTPELQWQREEIPANDRLRPGELILVQEFVTPSAALEQVRWEQNIPANCHTHHDEWKQFRQIGNRAALRLQSVRYEASAIDAGERLLHEYVIVPVRAGVCWFPAPRVTAAGQPIEIDLKSDFERVVVVETE